MYLEKLDAETKAKIKKIVDELNGVTLQYVYVEDSVEEEGGECLRFVLDSEDYKLIDRVSQQLKECLNPQATVVSKKYLEASAEHNKGSSVGEEYGYDLTHLKPVRALIGDYGDDGYGGTTTPLIIS